MRLLEKYIIARKKEKKQKKENYKIELLYLYKKIKEALDDEETCIITIYTSTYLVAHKLGFSCDFDNKMGYTIYFNKLSLARLEKKIKKYGLDEEKE